jgi:hypothetical protein
MRTTLQALLCSVAAACAPIGQHGDDHDGPDAGVDAGSAATCDQIETKTMDLTISGTSGFSGLPTKCWKLAGKLTLSSSSVTSLDKLGDLREVRDLVIDDTDLTKVDTKTAIEVTGDITIRNNDKLTDLTNVVPKTQLKSLLVEYNTQITSLGGLSKAVEIAGVTTIRNNTKLATLDLSHATRLVGGLTVSDNAELTTIDLHSLQSIGDATLGHDFTIRNNAKLTSLSNLSALEFVHGTFTIDNNDALTTLEGSMMSTTINDRKVVVDYNVVISNNALLHDTGGIAHVKYIGGSVSVSANPQLSYCEIREIDCCVDSGQVLVSGNQSSSCGQSGYSWCNQQLGYCPYM